MKYILLSSFLIIFSACSSIKPISKKSFERSQSTNVPANVELSLPGETVEETSLFPQVVPTEETVRLGDRGGDVYTPTEEGIETEQTASKKQLRIGLNLGPGLYRAINHVSLLKSLERQNLAPQVITGTGFGAIVAAMYASGMTPEMIEWNFYRYFKEKGNHRPYDTEWLEDVDQLLLEKLKNKNIQDTTKIFYITLYQAKTKKNVLLQ